MREPATEILLERAHDPGGVGPMLGYSLLAHAVVLVLVVLAPTEWMAPPSDEERIVMTISLGGAPGPRSGGMTPMGGRPIQQAIPLAEPPRPRAVRAPARETPEMEVPTPSARPSRPRPPVRSAPEEARGRTPTQGEEERPGSAIAETCGRGTGFGLSTGGGGGTGGYLDVANFCCPEYLSTMLQLIQRNWDSRQELEGSALAKFTIQRDGRITAVELERSSGYTALDLTAQRALLLTRQLPPLPAAFPDDHLTVHLIFEYQH